MAYAVIYLIQNIINFKVYIGQTENPKERWTEHKRSGRKPYGTKGKCRIHRAMTRFGVENFSFNIIEECTTQAETNAAEIFWISFFCATNKKVGYNDSPGGETPWNKGKKLGPAWNSGKVGVMPPSPKKGVYKINWPTDETLTLLLNANTHKEVANQIGSSVRRLCEYILENNIVYDRNTRLTEDNAKEIVRLYYNENLMQKEIAEKFNIVSSTVSAIVSGTTFANITGINKKDINNKCNHRIGIENGRAKLANNDVMEIIKLEQEKTFTQQELANKFNISKSTITNIVNGHRWQHITHINKLPNTPSRNNKLTEQTVIEAVNLYKTGQYTQKEIALKINVNKSTIAKALSGRNWTQTTGIAEPLNIPRKKDNYRISNRKNLTDQNVLDIVNLYNSGIYQYDIAKMFNITQASISSIISGKTYSYLTGIDRMAHSSKNVKLSPDNVLEIVQLYKTNKYTQKELSIMFGTKKTAISKLLIGASWSHITNIPKPPKKTKP